MGKKRGGRKKKGGAAPGGGGFLDVATATAEECKARGNELFMAKDHPGAIEMYTLAIEKLEDGVDRVPYYSNRSGAYAATWMVTGSAESAARALADAELCVAQSPDWAKGYFRLGTALKNLARNIDALAAFQRGLESDAANVDLLAAIEAMPKLKVDAMSAAETKAGELEENPEDDKFTRLESWLV